ncbi:MAG: hypothetical protein H7Z72_00160, partial [Bacteroidetes bacterium]|nr:hypothetical protein [Fibrella sp.]
MNRLSNGLHHAWFAPASAQRLATLRIVLGLYTLWYLVPRYPLLMEINRLPADSFEPVGAAAWLPEPLPT